MRAAGKLTVRVAVLTTAALLAACRLAGDAPEPAATTTEITAENAEAEAMRRADGPGLPWPEMPEPETTEIETTETETTETEATEPETPDLTAAEEGTEVAAAPAPEAADPAAPPPSNPAPHVYMSLQPGGGGPLSVVFTIDSARDGTPSDDPAIRLTPDGGLCNPQEMRHYNFPPADAARPVVTEADQAQGLTAARLPEFMAVAVTERMLADRLATDREETRALNICTRKLWERLIVAENSPASEPAPAGQ
jgi:hypothetical protein